VIADTITGPDAWFDAMANVIVIFETIMIVSNSA
jgi:hypothetical protein